MKGSIGSLATACFLSSTSVLAGGAANPSEPVIEDISVRPIDRATGEIGANIVDKAGTLVVNRRVKGFFVSQYLLTIRIRGMADLDLDGRVVGGFVRRLSLDVTEDGKPNKKLMTAVKTLGAIPPAGQLQVTGLIEPGGCHPVTITAALVGGRSRNAKQLTVDFVCQD